MNPVVMTRIVNPLIWIICGLAVIVFRAILTQNAYVLTAWAVGGIMITYGAIRLVWNLVSTMPPRTTTGKT